MVCFFLTRGEMSRKLELERQRRAIKFEIDALRKFQAQVVPVFDESGPDGDSNVERSPFFLHHKLHELVVGREWGVHSKFYADLVKANDAFRQAIYDAYPEAQAWEDAKDLRQAAFESWQKNKTVVDAAATYKAARDAEVDACIRMAIKRSAIEKASQVCKQYLLVFHMAMMSQEQAENPDRFVRREQSLQRILFEGMKTNHKIDRADVRKHVQGAPRMDFSEIDSDCNHGLTILYEQLSVIDKELGQVAVQAMEAQMSREMLTSKAVFGSMRTGASSAAELSERKVIRDEFGIRASAAKGPLKDAFRADEQKNAPVQQSSGAGTGLEEEAKEVENVEDDGSDGEKVHDVVKAEVQSILARMGVQDTDFSKRQAIVDLGLDPKLLLDSRFKDLVDKLPKIAADEKKYGKKFIFTGGKVGPVGITHDEETKENQTLEEKRKVDLILKLRNAYETYVDVTTHAMTLPVGDEKQLAAVLLKAEIGLTDRARAILHKNLDMFFSGGSYQLLSSHVLSLVITAFLPFVFGTFESATITGTTGVGMYVASRFLKDAGSKTNAIVLGSIAIVGLGALATNVWMHESTKQSGFHDIIGQLMHQSTWIAAACVTRGGKRVGRMVNNIVCGAWTWFKKKRGMRQNEVDEARTRAWQSSRLDYLLGGQLFGAPQKEMIEPETGLEYNARMIQTIDIAFSIWRIYANISTLLNTKVPLATVPVAASAKQKEVGETLQRLDRLSKSCQHLITKLPKLPQDAAAICDPKEQLTDVVLEGLKAAGRDKPTLVEEFASAKLASMEYFKTASMEYSALSPEQIAGINSKVADAAKVLKATTMDIAEMSEKIKTTTDDLARVQIDIYAKAGWWTSFSDMFYAIPQAKRELMEALDAAASATKDTVSATFSRVTELLGSVARLEHADLDMNATLGDALAMDPDTGTRLAEWTLPTLDAVGADWYNPTTLFGPESSTAMFKWLVYGSYDLAARSINGSDLMKTVSRIGQGMASVWNPNNAGAVWGVRSFLLWALMRPASHEFARKLTRVFQENTLSKPAAESKGDAKGDTKGSSPPPINTKYDDFALLATDMLVMGVSWFASSYLGTIAGQKLTRLDAGGVPTRFQYDAAVSVGLNRSLQGMILGGVAGNVVGQFSSEISSRMTKVTLRNAFDAQVREALAQIATNSSDETKMATRTSAMEQESKLQIAAAKSQPKQVDVLADRLLQHIETAAKVVAHQGAIVPLIGATQFALTFVDDSKDQKNPHGPRKDEDQTEDKEETKVPAKDSDSDHEPEPEGDEYEGDQGGEGDEGDEGDQGDEDDQDDDGGREMTPERLEMLKRMLES